MTQRPNIIVLMLDTARAQNFSCYGYERPTTPHIDTLARDSVLYEYAIASGCWSLPSQVSLLTGMRPNETRVFDGDTDFRDLHPDVVTLPQLFLEHGYAVARVGKVFPLVG